MMVNESLPILDLLDSFELHLRAKHRAAKTIRSYREALTQLALHVNGIPVGQKLEPEEVAAILASIPADSIGKADIEGYLAAVLAKNAPATARQRYASLVQFWKWTHAEGEVAENPMDRIEPPALVDQPVPVLTVDQARALIKSASGNGFDERRDTAVIRLFLDTGVRLGELAGLTVPDIDLSLAVAVVKGKGSRLRAVPYGDKTREALDRYRRQRARHAYAHLDAWWLGRKGALTDSGIVQLLRRRAGDAGIEGIHPHMFRHSFAHQWLAAGGNEGDLQRIAGWSSSQMVARYGRSAADQRARDNYRRNPLWGDL